MTFGAIEFLIEGNPTAAMADFAPAVTRGLVDIRFPKNSDAETLYDWADATNNGSIVGVPVYSAGSARFKASTNYVQTANPQTHTRTIIAVAKTPDSGAAGATTGMIAGNQINNVEGFYIGFGQSGGQIALLGRTARNAAGVPGNSLLSTLLLPVDGGDVYRVYYIVMNLVGGTYSFRVGDLTRGLDGNTVTFTDPQILGQNIRYGSNSNTAILGLCDIAAIFDYNVALSGDELSKMYQQIKQYMAEEATPIIV